MVVTTAWVPPRRTYHLRIFAVSLVIVVIALVAFLFLVRLEALMPATGVIAARGQEEVRAPAAGLVEPGWYEGAAGKIRVRVDGQGKGVTEPGETAPLAVANYKLKNGATVDVNDLTFHKLTAGDELWPGQPLADIRAAEGNRVRAVLPVPAGANHWLVLKVYPDPRQAVAAGDPVALVAPLDPATHQPKSLVAILDVHEKHMGELEPGQAIRIFSSMYNQRLHGHADGVIERVEPLGEPLQGGERRFRAIAAVTTAPFTLRPGSSFKAEIIVGRKQVYRIILEQ
jgi:hypothetical protein